MTRREYRSPTGKLRGYSQTDTGRYGRGGFLTAAILLIIAVIGYLI